MERRIWLLVRWPLVILLMVLVVWFTIPRLLEALAGTVEVTSDLPATSPGATTTSGPAGVTDGSARAAADVSVVDGIVARRGDETLVLGDDRLDTVLVAFPRIAGDPSCLEQVLLEMTVLQAAPAELGVWSSSVDDLAALTTGERAPPQLLTGGAQPSARALTDGSPGRLRWDVTSAYTQSAATSAEDGQVVLGVRAAAPVEEDPAVIFAARESGDTGSPTLTWTGVEGCGSS